jgi:hypothetical protein
VGPDSRRHVRNILILLVLAAGVWLLPGGRTGTYSIYNLLTVILTAGLLFFGYRLYMEHRATLFGLGDRNRGLGYGCVALIGFALIATDRLWNQGGLGVLLWLGMIGLGVWGLYSLWRTWQAY